MSYKKDDIEPDYFIEIKNVIKDVDDSNGIRFEHFVVKVLEDNEYSDIPNLLLKDWTNEYYKTNVAAVITNKYFTELVT